MQVLENLHAEYKAEEKLLSEKSDLKNEFGLGDLYELEESLKTMQEFVDAKTLQFLQEKTLTDQAVREIGSINTIFEKLYLLLQDIEDVLFEKFGINHVNIQPEFKKEDPKDFIVQD